MCNNIVLIGFMGCGKSSVGKVLSQKLKIHFIDSDSVIQEMMQMSIKDIFNIYGETYFRNLEKNFITEHQNLTRHLISTGGGMPIFHDVSMMGKVFFLNTSFNTIATRLLKDNNKNRPLFENMENAYQIFLQRQKIYETKCDIIINGEQSITQIVEEIIKNLSPDTYGT